jgi:Na+/melibiose symporter-like transporter
MAGLGGGTGAVLAPSIQADIIDYDEFTTGNREMKGLTWQSGTLSAKFLPP